MLEGYPDIKRLKTDIFRDRINYSMEVKNRLAEARRGGLAAIRAGSLGARDDRAQSATDS